MEPMYDDHVERASRRSPTPLRHGPGHQVTRVRLIGHLLEGRSRYRHGAFPRLVTLGALVVIFLLSGVPASACA
jgi:hypothetical protein